MNNNLSSFWFLLLNILLSPEQPQFKILSTSWALRCQQHLASSLLRGKTAPSFCSQQSSKELSWHCCARWWTQGQKVVSQRVYRGGGRQKTDVNRNNVGKYKEISTKPEGKLCSQTSFGSWNTTAEWSWLWLGLQRSLPTPTIQWFSEYVIKRTNND